ncbi:prolyl oligopeptidase family protein [Streptomyces albus]|uniref:hypothetical protein n=1 Tax=Streptomyces sp. HPH0547 TaxID=1203592 RepID=UPI0012B9D735|nr:hypothetical protein [Streptomyces sp. HPH0547]
METTRTGDDVDEVAGVRFADPYRWLEANTEEVRGWQDAQGEAAAGRWFRIEPVAGSIRPSALVSDEPYGEGRVLFDPAAENPGKPPFLSWISPSPDGTVLAVGVCADGSERNTIRLVDVASGALLPDAPTQFLRDSWTGGAKWLPDSSGFFFTGTDDDPVSSAHEVWLHLRHGMPSTVAVDVPWLPGDDYRAVVASADGRHAVAVQGLFAPVPVAVAKLHDPTDLAWREFVTDASLNLAGFLVGDEWIAVTDAGAPRGRVVAVWTAPPRTTPARGARSCRRATSPCVPYARWATSSTCTSSSRPTPGCAWSTTTVLPSGWSRCRAKARWGSCRSR